MIERDETVYVRHILDAIDRIGRYIRGVTEDAFFADSMLQDAVVRQLEILGEAAGRISLATCRRAPSIPWAEVRGMRHRLIHGYFEVDTAMVWDVATLDLVELAPKVEDLLCSLPVVLSRSCCTLPLSLGAPPVADPWLSWTALTWPSTCRPT